MILSHRVRVSSLCCASIRNKSVRVFLLRKSVPCSPESHAVLSADGLRIRGEVEKHFLWGWGAIYPTWTSSSKLKLTWNMMLEIFGNSNRIICPISWENDVYCILILCYPSCSCSHNWFLREVWSQSELRKVLQTFWIPGRSFLQNDQVETGFCKACETEIKFFKTWQTELVTGNLKHCITKQLIPSDFQ